MGNICSFTKPKEKITISYLSPCVLEWEGLRYFFGLSKESKKIYMCAGDQYTREDVENPDVKYVCHVKNLEFTSNDDVLVGFEHVKCKYEKLKSGNILSYSLNSNPLRGAKAHIMKRPERKFVPQGHEEFDKLAVLFETE